MKIGQKYEVIYSETKDGKIELEIMTLKSIHQYKGKEVYVYIDNTGYPFVTYNHDGNIDWEFLYELDDKFSAL